MLLALSPLTACASMEGTGPAMTKGYLVIGQPDFSEVDGDGKADGFGFTYTSEAPGSSFGWEAGIFQGDLSNGAGEDEEGVGVEYIEVFGGIRKTFEEIASKMKPYVGGGISLANSTVYSDHPAGIDDRDVDLAVAPYIHGGVDYEISENLSIGLNLRINLGTEVDVEGPENYTLETDNTQISLLIGWGF